MHVKYLSCFQCNDHLLDKVLLTDTISNMPAIAEILGCMFAPGSPSCDKDIKDKPVSAITDAEVD